jgi:hypothetical protein
MSSQVGQGSKLHSAVAELEAAMHKRNFATFSFSEQEAADLVVRRCERAVIDAARRAVAKTAANTRKTKP